MEYRNRIQVNKRALSIQWQSHFEYEWRHAQTGQWFRAHGKKHWEFDDDGLMRVRDMSANDLPISKQERRYKIGEEIDKNDLAC